MKKIITVIFVLIAIPAFPQENCSVQKERMIQLQKQSSKIWTQYHVSNKKTNALEKKIQQMNAKRTANHQAIWGKLNINIQQQTELNVKMRTTSNPHKVQQAYLQLRKLQSQEKNFIAQVIKNENQVKPLEIELLKLRKTRHDMYIEFQKNQQKLLKSSRDFSSCCNKDNEQTSN